jgi:nucleotide-binding universal stress UspA family protein
MTVETLVDFAYADVQIPLSRTTVRKKKLLVPMDGSASALKALKWAAGDPPTTLLVLNVQLPIRSSRFVSKAMIAEHQQRNAEKALAPARALVKRLKIEARLFTAIGDPAAESVAFARKQRCTGIVMGNRGKHPVAGLLLGSVATRVIHLAKCPVTIVK